MVMVETTQSCNKEEPNPTKIFSQFLFKALIFTVLFALVTKFFSQKPELANQTRLFLHLFFVGIAISYGLFRRWNYDEEEDGGSNNNDYSNADHLHNNSNSYVPEILEVSSVFNVSHESESKPSNDSSGDTWRNKHSMKAPEIVHTEDHDTRFVDRDSSGIREKPSSSFSSPRKLTPNCASELYPSPQPPPSPPPSPLPAFYNSASRKDPGTYRIEPRKPSVHKNIFEGREFHSPPPPPPRKFRISSERRKSSEQKTKIDDRSAKRNSPKKMWWSDPIVESKEQDTDKNNDQRGFLGSKPIEESKDEEHRRRENEIHDNDDEKKTEDEGVSESDVDKKADEFIAKFREQIRLQRIGSIKRSANKISANSPR